MTYPYECRNKDCLNFEVEVEVTKPMAESDTIEKCKKCTLELHRIYKSFGAKTSDGYKASV